MKRELWLIIPAVLAAILLAWMVVRLMADTAL